MWRETPREVIIELFFIGGLELPYYSLLIIGRNRFPYHFNKRGSLYSLVYSQGHPNSRGQ